LFAVGAVHECSETFGGQAAFHSGVIFEDVENDATNCSKVLRRAGFAGLVVIFAEAGVQDSVALILNTPVLTDCFLKQLGVALDTTQIIATFSLSLLSRRHYSGVSFYHNETLEFGPTFADFCVH